MASLCLASVGPEMWSQNVGCGDAISLLYTVSAFEILKSCISSRSHSGAALITLLYIFLRAGLLFRGSRSQFVPSSGAFLYASRAP